MDIHWQKYCHQVSTIAAKEDNQRQKKRSVKINFYKTVITEDKAWKALNRMGRPMWWSTFTSGGNVVGLAANKLLLGLPPGLNTYTESTMFGVASMLCRIGVRPNSTSAFASRAVADFMAILAYVNYERGGYLSSYASDPVLALGAMKVWYAVGDALPTYILPQLKKLILDEVLDTGGIDEMVARILLLLAMDKCAMAGKPIDQTGVYRKKMHRANSEVPALQAWRSKWKGWQMGLTHFVQLQLQPNEDKLWYLLGRRAAGVFPRHQYGADLLIPIFRKASVDKSKMETNEEEERVSLILIQVKNRVPTDNEFSQSASNKVCPWFEFGDESDNLLSKKSVHEIIRIFMNLRDEPAQSRERKCFVYSTTRTGFSRQLKKANEDVHSSDTTKEQAVTANEDKQKDEKHAKKQKPNQKIQKRTSPTANDGKQMKEKHAKKQKSNLKMQTRSSTTLTDDEQMEETSADDEETAQGGTVEDEAKVEGSVFTYCFRSLCCETFPFLSEDVAKTLASMVAPLWDPMALVEGDLERRRTIEESFQGDNFKAIDRKRCQIVN